MPSVARHDGLPSNTLVQPGLLELQWLLLFGFGFGWFWQQFSDLKKLSLETLTVSWKARVGRGKDAKGDDFGRMMKDDFHSKANGLLSHGFKYCNGFTSQDRESLWLTHLVVAYLVWWGSTAEQLGWLFCLLMPVAPQRWWMLRWRPRDGIAQSPADLEA